MSIEVADAAEEHLPAIAAIYARAAANSHATFDVEGHPAEWWAKVPEREELLVALEDGEVLGFAKTGRFKDRPGYNSTRETSAYVHADHRGKGVGNALYTELLRRLEAADGPADGGGGDRSAEPRQRGAARRARVRAGRAPSTTSG